MFFYFCTQDINRLCKLGLCVSSQSLQSKLSSWKDKLDEEVLELRNGWASGVTDNYQLVGDNWDKNILPSYRYTTNLFPIHCITAFYLLFRKKGHIMVWCSLSVWKLFLINIAYISYIIHLIWQKLDALYINLLRHAIPDVGLILKFDLWGTREGPN